MSPPGEGTRRVPPSHLDEGATVDALIGGARVSAYRALLRNRNYRLWFSTAFCAGLADWTGLFALQVAVTALTESGSRLALFALGGIMMARLLPSVVVGPVAGVLADRYDRKRLMVFTNVARGLLYVGVALSESLVTLFTLVFVVETMSLLFLASKDASLPVIVRRDHLTQANQLNLLASYGTLPLGAVVASLMIPVAALARSTGLGDVRPELLALLGTALAFLLAAGLLSRLVLPARVRSAGSRGSESGVLEELREGLRFIRDLPIVRALILGVIGVFFSGGVVITLGPAFVQTSLAASNSDWFTLMALVGIGVATGILLVPLVLRVARKERVFPVSLGAAGALATVIATLPTLGVTLVFGFLLGATAGMSFVTGYTLLHEYTDDAVRARTFAAFYTGTRLALFSSLALTPFVAGAVGRGTVILGGWSFTMSGIRLTMLAAGLFAVACSVAAGRGMYAALRHESARSVRLPGGDDPSPTNGVFVAFEGIEGSGKSTQIESLAATLQAEGYEVVVTREPGGAPVSELIRRVLLDPSTGAMDARSEALLLAAARVEHVQQVILPALEAGRVVLCDRFLDSSLAYQGHARGLGFDDVFEINRWAIGGLIPDVVLLLHLDPAEGLRRAARRSVADGAAGEGDRLEREGLEFHERVGEGFMRLARRERQRFRIVDATGEVADVARRIRLELAGWLPERRDQRSGNGVAPDAQETQRVDTAAPPAPATRRVDDE